MKLKLLLAATITLIICGLALAVYLPGFNVDSKGAPIAHARQTLVLFASVQATYQQQQYRNANNKLPGEYGSLYDILSMGCITGINYYGYIGRDMDKWSASFLCEHSEGADASYCYKIYIPEKPEEAEKHWCAYAWPLKNYGNYTALFTSEKGLIYFIKEKKYIGFGNGPKVGDAYKGEPFKSEIDASRWEPFKD